MMLAYEMKDSGVETLGKIPTHWARKKIKNGFYLKPSNVDKKSHDDELPVELCNYVDVYYNDFIINELAFMAATAKPAEIDKFSLQIDDVIITKDSEDPMDIGVPALVKENKPNLLCGYHLTMLKKRLNNISGAFLFWVLKDTSIASQLYREATGVTRWAISSRNIKNVSIPLPDFNEQKAIANYLDKACEKVDKTLLLKQQQLEKLDAYRKSTIQEAVTKGLDKNASMKDSKVEWLGSIPKHWSLDRLKDVSTLRDKKTRLKSDINDYIELEDISQWTGKITNKKNTLNVASDVIKFHKGDVLFGKLRPYLAKVALAKFEGKCTGEILAIQPTFVLGSFLSYYLISNNFINHCNNFSYGAKMPRINWNTQMGTFPISFPDKAEQKVIADYLEKACEQIDKTKTVIESQITKLTQYRQSLIHECVTGKKRIYQGDIN